MGARVDITFSGENRSALAATRQTRREIQTLEGQTARSSASMQRSFGGVGSAIGSLARRATFGLGLIGTAGAGLATKMGLNFYNIKQAGQIAFTTMLGSGEKARKFLDRLADFAAKTPFDFPGLVQGSQRMLGMGIQADKIIPTLQATATAVASIGGGAEQIDQTTRALGQIQAKGRLQAEEMLQLNESVGFSWQALADELGVTARKAMDLSQRGQVSASEFLRAFRRHYREFGKGLLEQNSQTLAGLWSTFKDTFSQVSAEVLTPFFEAARGGLKRVNGFMDDLAKARTLHAKLDVVWTGIEDAGDALWDKIREAFEGSVETRKLEVRPGQFLTVLDEREGIGQRIADSVADADWGRVADRIAGGLAAALGAGLAFGGRALGFLDTLLGGVADWVSSHTDELADTGATILLTMISDFVDPSWWASHWRLAVGVALAAFPIGRLGGGLLRLLARPFGRLGGFLGPLIVDGIGRAFGAAESFIARRAPSLSSLFAFLSRGAQQGVSDALQFLTELPARVPGMLDRMGSLIERNIPRFLRRAFRVGFILDALALIPKGGQAVADYFQGGFEDDMHGAFQWVVRNVLGFFVDRIADWAETVLGIADKAFGWVPGVGGKIDDARQAVQRMRSAIDHWGQSADRASKPIGTLRDGLRSSLGLVRDINSTKLVFHIQGLAGLHSAAAYVNDLNAGIGRGDFGIPMPGFGGLAGGGLVAVGRQLQRMGFLVAENPAFGGVTPGVHTANSYHYRGRAIDVNWPGGGPTELGQLQRIYAMLLKLPHAELMIEDAGRQNQHLHLAMRHGGIVPGYDTGADTVPARLRPGEVVLSHDHIRQAGGLAMVRALFGLTGNAGPGFAAGGIVQQIRRLRRHGVDRDERDRLRRLMDRLRAALQRMSDAASHQVTMAEQGLSNLELRQQLAGTFDTLAGARARARFIHHQEIPELRDQRRTLERELKLARQAHNRSLVRELEEAIKRANGDVLQAQLDAQNAIKDATEKSADSLDDLSGTFTFTAHSQRYSDLVASVGFGI